MISPPFCCHFYSSTQFLPIESRSSRFEGENCKFKMAEQEPTRSYTDEQLNSDAVSKKEIIKFLQDNAAFEVSI